jgi:hypothetical protein
MGSREDRPTVWLRPMNENLYDREAGKELGRVHGNKQGAATRGCSKTAKYPRHSTFADHGRNTELDQGRVFRAASRACIMRGGHSSETLTSTHQECNGKL